MNNNFFSDITMKLDSIALIKEDSDTVTGEDVIHVNVPTFLRLIELVREDIKDDVPLHYLTEILTRLSKTGVVTMEDYETIENYTMQDAEQEPEDDSVYEGRHDGNWMKDGVEMCSKECCGEPVTECTCGPDCKHCDCYEKNKAMNESAQMMTEEQFDEAAGEKDACYHKVKSRYKVWPSAYASGALVQCRKVGAANWGNKSK